MRILIVTSTGFSNEWFKEIHASENSDSCIIESVPDNIDQILDKLPNVDALIGCPRWAFSKKLIDTAGSTLKWIHLGGAGCEEFMIPELINSNIQLTNGKIIQGPPVADHAIALTLVLTRNLNKILTDQNKVRNLRSMELYGKKAVIIGMGGIGMLIAERLKSFGVKIIGVDEEYKPLLSFIENSVRPSNINDVLPTADLIYISAPLTEDSHKLFGHDEFKRTKKGAYFFAVSRGGLYDLDSLVEAIDSGIIAGAGLDVTDPEPLPKNHILWSMENVIITPHVAGLSNNNRRKNFDLIKENISRFNKNLPLLNIVNKSRGY